jgi:SAM-dependent methyltransferase
MPGVEAAQFVRDTDADWRALGDSQPYWGVLSHPDFLTENITPDRIEAFYATGKPYIADIARRLEAATGAAPSGRSLDFGCGVGRLTEAMTDYASEVVGVDVSPGMLALAQARGGKATYAAAPPDGPFDWINSFIVLQHIPTHRGEEILADLMARLAPGGAISIQLSAWRDADRYAPAVTGWRRFFKRSVQEDWERTTRVGQIFMYDYDLSRVVRLLNQAGIEEMSLVSTNHDGHRGVIILGRKTAEPYQS